MSSISALKVVLLSRKKESRVLIGILLSFVFCLSSLKINIYAENITTSESMNVAYAFFWNMGFREATDNGFLHYMQNYNVSGASVGTRSPDVNPQIDTVYIVYYDFSGGDNIRITNNNDSLNVGLGGVDNLYIARITGSSSTKVYFNGNAQVIPIYVGNKNAMPTDIYALCTNENVQELLKDIVTNSSSISSDVSSMKSMQVSQYQRLGSIVTNTSNTNTKLDTVNSNINTTNSTLNITNSKLQDISSYLINNNSTTNTNVSNNNTQKSTFDNKASSLATFESTQGTNLDTNLQTLDINSNTGLLVNSSFVKSALWVNDMFDQLIVGSPFELVLVFCLSIGIAFAMIGKVR